MVLNKGDKIHVVTRRSFESDLRRHFVGEVLETTNVSAQVEGYAFVYSTHRDQFIRKLEKRRRIITLIDSGLIITLIPAEVSIEDLKYVYSERRLVL